MYKIYRKILNSVEGHFQILIKSSTLQSLYYATRYNGFGYNTARSWLPNGNFSVVSL